MTETLGKILIQIFQMSKRYLKTSEVGTQFSGVLKAQVSLSRINTSLKWRSGSAVKEKDEMSCEGVYRK